MAFSQPENIVASLQLPKGIFVADIGCGVGGYTFPLARAVGQSGKVFALDVQQDILDRLHQDAERLGLRNITPVWCNAERYSGTRLRDQSVDMINCANVIFQIEDKLSFFKEIARILKPKGTLLVIEWSGSYGGIGPHPDDVISQQQLEQWCREQGFSVQRTLLAGEHHYGVLFEKQ